jgi:hypothetical protein
MSLEITNSLRSSSIIRVTDAGTATISLANLSANAALETVSSATIRRVVWSTNGNITVARNGITLLALHNAGDMNFADFGHALANSNSSPIVVTVTTGGTIMLDVTKDTQYSTALVGM